MTTLSAFMMDHVSTGASASKGTRDPLIFHRRVNQETAKRDVQQTAQGKASVLMGNATVTRVSKEKIALQAYVQTNAVGMGRAPSTAACVVAAGEGQAADKHSIFQ